MRLSRRHCIFYLCLYIFHLGRFEFFILNKLKLRADFPNKLSLFHDISKIADPMLSCYYRKVTFVISRYLYIGVCFWHIKVI